MEGAPKLDKLSRLLAGSTTVRAVAAELEAGSEPVVSCADPVRPALVAALRSSMPSPVLVVAAGADGARSFARDLALYLGESAVRHFPEFEEFAWDASAPDPAAAGQRARAVHELSVAAAPPVVVASARALLRRIQPPSSGHYQPLGLAAGATLPPGVAAQRLVELGYERVGNVEEPGQFALRGGILDVFAGSEPAPARAEYFGDEIESLRRFVASSQQSIGPAGETLVFACTDLARDLETGRPALPSRIATLLDALPASGLVVLVEPKALFDDMARTYDEIRAAAPVSAKAPGKVRGYLSPGEVALAERRRLTLFTIEDSGVSGAVRIESGRPEPMLGRMERLVATVKNDVAAGRTVALALRDVGQVDRVAEILAEADVGLARPADGPKPGAVWLVDADLSSGWTLTEPAVTVYAHGELFYASRRFRGATKAVPSSRLAAVHDFAAGDYVVHRTHGIARYAGMTRQDVGGAERDYLLLEYAAGDKLYIPVDQIDRVSRYIGDSAAPPKLTRLATADWSRATARARASVKALAVDLAKLYAERSSITGYAFGPDTEWQRELAAGFPFVETPDQGSAIEAVRSDMERPRPMDRLVCGDVGYGKTEVAIRAAFKAVQDGKQAIVLAPTTILAQQHFQVFCERYAPFPVKVEVLSRFRTARQQAQIVERFNDGEVDVLIGTHRLLSPDVKPKDLGLIVVDEEQRFGVAHKEHFTDMRRAVDVLTLSATPIPRTLQMALSGVRDLSLIETPPEDRHPVETYVGRFDSSLAASAIRRELARDGQVYYVHNRIRDIDSVAAHLAELVPEASIAVGHGQMHEHALEQVMLHFLEQQTNVLVCTTIIENGLDIPSANTLVVENAERLGLAQLYQLRGRVGRSTHRAHAYFFYGDIERLTGEAAERLKTIHDFTSLGSGVKIALRDLEIRGAGNLLGPEQSGQMSAVGFELYVQMLREAVGELIGEPVASRPEVRIDLPIDAYVPVDYIPDEVSRIEAYKQLADAADTEELAAAVASLRDRYGKPLPPPVAALVEVLRVKMLAVEIGIAEIVVRRGQATVTGVSLSTAQAAALAARTRARYVENARKVVARLGTPALGAELPVDDTIKGVERLLDAILGVVVQA